jgi:hypothetical protein
LDTTTGTGVVLGVSIALFVATELLFPIDETNKTAVKQKHFWSTMLFIFSLVLGLPVETSLRVESEIKNLQHDLDRHDKDSSLHGGFEDMYLQYRVNFGEAQPPLDGWAAGLLDYLRETFTTGQIPLPLERAPEQIAKVYSHAEEGIVATNVGSTITYFNEGNYLEANISTRDRGVPIIRFYLYDDDHKTRIKMRNGKTPQNIQEFFDEVKDLHWRTGSFYSTVIDVQYLPDHKDFLIMDNKFVAETLISPDWNPIRAQASQNQRRLAEARSYFHELRGKINPEFTLKMRPEEVKARFSKNRLLPPASTQTADSLFQYLMRKIAN